MIIAYSRKVVNICFNVLVRRSGDNVPAAADDAVEAAERETGRPADDQRADGTAAQRFHCHGVLLHSRHHHLMANAGLSHHQQS